MSDSNQTANGIAYATHVQARNTGFVTSNYLPRRDNEDGQSALVESLMTYARERGVEFDGDGQ